MLTSCLRHLTPTTMDRSALRWSFFSTLSNPIPDLNPDADHRLLSFRADDSLLLMLLPLFWCQSWLKFSFVLAVGLCYKSVHHSEGLHHGQTQLGLQSVRSQQGRLHHQRGAPILPLLLCVCVKVLCWAGGHVLHSQCSFLSPLPLQEMTDIMHSIYDMMGKYTYPNMRDSAPKEHVDSFFQVKHKSHQTNARSLGFQSKNWFKLDFLWQCFTCFEVALLHTAYVQRVFL